MSKPSTLHEAIDSGNSTLVRELIEAKADVDALGVSSLLVTNELFTPLAVAVLSDKTEIVRILLDAGAVVDKVSWSNCTPLHLSACKLNLDIMELLLKFKADPNARDSKQYTALHGHDFSISDINYAPAINLLLDARANPHLANDEGITPIDRAVGLGTKNIINIFAQNFKTSFECECEGLFNEPYLLPILAAFQTESEAIATSTCLGKIYERISEE